MVLHVVETVAADDVKAIRVRAMHRKVDLLRELGRLAEQRANLMTHCAAPQQPNSPTTRDTTRLSEGRTTPSTSTVPSAWVCGPTVDHGVLMAGTR